jgi:hypothetical protein
LEIIAEPELPFASKILVIVTSFKNCPEKPGPLAVN